MKKGNSVFLLFSFLTLFHVSNNVYHGNKIENTLLTYETIILDSIFSKDGICEEVAFDKSEFTVLTLKREGDIVSMSVTLNLQYLRSNYLADLKDNIIQKQPVKLDIDLEFINGKELKIKNWKIVKNKILQAARETYKTVKDDLPEIEELAYLMYTEALNNIRTHEDIRRIVYSKLEFLLLPYTFDNNEKDTLIQIDSLENPFNKIKKIEVTSLHVKSKNDAINASEVNSTYTYDFDEFIDMMRGMYEKYFKQDKRYTDSAFVRVEPQQKIIYDDTDLELISVSRRINIELSLPKIGFKKRIRTEIILPKD